MKSSLRLTSNRLERDVLGTFIHPDRENIFRIVILLHWKAAVFSGRLLILLVTLYSTEYIIVILLEKIGWFIDKFYLLVN
jgi:hypothetical protein